MEVGWVRKDEAQTSCRRVNKEDRGRLESGVWPLRAVGPKLER